MRLSAEIAEWWLSEKSGGCHQNEFYTGSIRPGCLSSKPRWFPPRRCSMIRSFAIVYRLFLPAMLLMACAQHTDPVLSPQTITVLVSSPPGSRVPLLLCHASNAVGDWTFTAPGEVTVMPSQTALHLQCHSEVGVLVSDSSSAESGFDHQNTASSSQTGAMIGGATVGTLAAAMGGAFLGPGGVAILAAGGAMRGAEIGGMMGVDMVWRYPSLILLHLDPSNPAIPDK